MYVSTCDVFIKTYWGPSQLKLTFRNYKKILYARSDLICFDSIFDQIESSTFKQYCQDLLQTASAL